MTQENQKSSQEKKVYVGTDPEYFWLGVCLILSDVVMALGPEVMTGLFAKLQELHVSRDMSEVGIFIIGVLFLLKSQKFVTIHTRETNESQNGE